MVEAIREKLKFSRFCYLCSTTTPATTATLRFLRPGDGDLLTNRDTSLSPLPPTCWRTSGNGTLSTSIFDAGWLLRRVVEEQSPVQGDRGIDSVGKDYYTRARQGWGLLVAQAFTGVMEADPSAAENLWAAGGEQRLHPGWWRNGPGLRPNNPRGGSRYGARGGGGGNHFFRRGPKLR